MAWLLRIWILFTIFFSVYTAYISFSATVLSGLKAKAVMSNAYQIHQACFAYSQGHEQKFPDGNSANEAFRELFRTELIDDEDLFFIRTKNHSSPDKKIGNKADGFLEALAPGECSYYYVKPNPEENNPKRLLLFTRLGVQGRVMLVTANIGGNAAFERIDDAQPEVFTNEYIAKKFNLDPRDILTPEGPLPGPWEIPKISFLEMHCGDVLIRLIVAIPVLLFLRSRLHKPEILDSV